MPAHAPEPPTAVAEPLAARLPRALGWLLVGVVLWASRLALPVPAARPELDPSWQQGLAYALSHGLQFGPDLIFTFGPLGALSLGRYQPELFVAHVVLFEFLFKGLLAWRWVEALRRWPSALDRAAFLGFLLGSALSLDAFYFATVVVLAVRHAEAPPAGRARLAIDCLLLAAIGYVKFTYLLLAAVAISVLAARAWRRDRRGALALAGTYAAALVVVWSACGQAPWHLPTFLARSLAIASGYSEAQAENGPFHEVTVALVWLTAALALALATVSWTALRAERACAALIVSFGAWVAFKASFTYHASHGFTFFGYGALATCALRPAADTPSARRIALGVGRAVAALVAVAGLSTAYDRTAQMVELTVGEGAQRLVRSGRGLLRLPGLREQLEADRRATAKEFALPRLAALVGTGTVDFMSSATGYVFLNGLAWKPRPVFQSYLTVTPGLLEANGAALEGPEAPDWVLLELASISRRLAGMEDSAALRALLRCYAPVAMERGVALLRREPAEAARPEPTYTVLEEREARPGEVVRLDALLSRPEDALRVRFEVRYSLLGGLRRLLYHAPITRIHLDLDGGGTIDARLLPGIASEGVLLRPYCESTSDWIRLYTRGPEKRVAAFSVVSTDDWDALYAPRYRVVVERCDGLLPEPDLAREIPLVFGSFGTPPSAVGGRSGPRQVVLEGRDVVLVGPSAHLSFTLEPGEHRLSGACGLLPEAEVPAEGIEFVAWLAGAAGAPRRLFEHRLLPSASSGGPLSLDVAFSSNAGEKLVLSTLNPPASVLHFDVAYWEAIRVE